MSTPAAPDPRDWFAPGGEPFATADEIAVARACAAADAAELESWLPAPDDPAWSWTADMLGLQIGCDDDIALEDADQEREIWGNPHPADLLRLAATSPEALADPSHVLDHLREVERMEAFVVSLRLRALVALAGPEASTSSLDDDHMVAEVAVARRIGRGAAGSGIELARALATSFPGFAAALAAGEVSEWHCRELVTGTRAVRDTDVLSRIEVRVLPKARRRTPSELRRDIARAVASLDADADVRRERARNERHVACRPLEDGMGFLGLVHEWPVVQAMHASITADGRALRAERGAARAVSDGDIDATADACHADAFAARVLGRVGDDGSVTWDRREQPVCLTVVMDLDTLRGEAERLALVDGEPVPAEAGRDLAGIATLWRRAITSPVDGHLLDYGTEQYLPEPLRRFVLARDGRCRIPGCPQRAASRLQMDHALPFPEGRSSAGNCGALCVRHHQLKTAGLLRLEGGAPDGSVTLRTRWRQEVRVPAHPFLDDPPAAPDSPRSSRAGTVDPPPPADGHPVPRARPQPPPF